MFPRVDFVSDAKHMVFSKMLLLSPDTNQLVDLNMQMASNPDEASDLENWFPNFALVVNCTLSIYRQT